MKINVLVASDSKMIDLQRAVDVHNFLVYHIRANLWGWGFRDWYARHRLKHAYRHVMNRL